jgi:hypothetical protein
MDFEKIKIEIDALYNACLEKTTPFHIKIDICIVPEYLAKMVFEATEIDVSNHWITIDNYGIVHTLQQHSNPITEAKRGQVAVEKDDFLKWIQVVLHPDEIKHLGDSKRSLKPILQFEKIIEHKKIVVKEVRTVTSTKKNKISRLVFHTMYKFKKPN